MPGTEVERQRRRWALLTLVCAAVVLRLGQYLANKSLWLDEAALGLQITEQSFAAALHPSGQVAPVGFVWMVKAATLALGDSELVLRLVPLLSGIASVWLFLLVAERHLEWPATLVAVGLFAVSDRLIYYSAELKQYSTDVAVALLLWVTIAGQSEHRVTWRRAGLLGGVGATAVWFSHPSVFVLAGLGAATVFEAWRRGPRVYAGPLALMATLWGLSLTASYVLTIRGVSGASDGLREFWGFAFAPLPPRSIADLRWFPETFLEVFRDPAGFAVPGVAMLAFLAGGIWMIKEQPTRSLLFLGPVPIVLLASALRQYPFSGRLLLFLVPPALLLIAHGGARIGTVLARSSRLVAATFVLLLTVPPVAEATYRFVRPRTTEEIRSVMNRVREAWRDGDHLYVYYGARPAFEYYAARTRLAAVPTSFGTASREGWQQYLSELDALRGRRVWLLFAHVYDWGAVDEEQLFLFHLDRHGVRLDQISDRRASAYLYDLSRAE